MLARMILAGPIEFTPMESFVLLMFLAAMVLTPIGAILLVVGVVTRHRHQEETDPAGLKALRRARTQIVAGLILLVPAIIIALTMLIEGLRDSL